MDGWMHRACNTILTLFQKDEFLPTPQPPCMCACGTFIGFPLPIQIHLHVSLFEAGSDIKSLQLATSACWSSSLDPIAYLVYKSYFCDKETRIDCTVGLR